MTDTGLKTSDQSVRAFYETALRAKQAGELDDAERVCRRGQVIYPRDPNLLCLLGEILLARRQPQEAQSWFSRTLKNFPDYPRALEGKGRALLAERKPRRAARYLRQAAEALPDRYSTHLALGRALAMSGEGAEAERAIQRAIELNPDKAVISQASEAMSAGQAGEAEKILREHLAAKPDDPVALRLLATIAMDANRWRPSLRLLRRAVESGPDFTLGWIDLTTVLMKLDRYAEALEAADTAIGLDPSLPHAWVAKGGVLSKAQRHDEALEAYQKALELSPVHGGALAGMGHVLKTVGRQEESVAAYRKCIEAHPAYGEAYWSLANLKTFEFTAEEVGVMERMVGEPHLGDEPKVNFHYALGKQYDGQEQFERAFEHYRAGAELRRAQETYDPVHTQHLHDRIIETFTPEFLAARAGWGDPSPDPILIVGLPRSGSTLIEQILASHSQVEGTMELPDLSRAVRDINRSRKDGVQYPEALEPLPEGALLELGRNYMESTRRYRTGLPYFIDKMPNNFPMIGLLHLMLPNARVINARRHPLDSCLGTWKQLFFNGQSFSYDFFELGQYYLQYQRIMDHWHRVLPGKVLDVRYEDLVRDQEAQTRRILDYLGLPWEDGCLRFWETERAINTASSEQVRQPIYTKALNYWRNYEPQIGELIAVLAPLLRELPAEDRPASLA